MESKQAQQLYIPNFNNNQCFINLNESLIETLSSTFDTNKQIVVICTAGVMGAGKSTLLNVLAHLLDSNLVSEVFKTSSELISCTEGIWIYPYPLNCKNNQQIQVLLCDMEGQGGIRGNDLKATDEVLKKLYFLGMIISSSYILCSNERPTAQEIGLLQTIYDAVKLLQSDLGVEIPQLTMFMKQKQKITEKDIQNFKSAAQKASIPSEILDGLQIKPGQVLDEDFTEEKKFETLGTSNLKYKQEMEKYLNEALKSPLKSFGTNTFATIKDVVEIFKKADGIINSKNFVIYLTSALEEQIYQLSLEIQQDIIHDFKLQSETFALECDIKNTTDDLFNKQIAILKQNSKAQLEQWFEQNIKRKQGISNAIGNVWVAVEKNLIQSQAELKFYMRKSEVALEDQKVQLTQKIQQVQEEGVKKQEEGQQAMLVLSEQHGSEIQKMQEQQLQTEQQFTAKMQNQQQQFNQKIDETKKLYDQNSSQLSFLKDMLQQQQAQKESEFRMQMEKEEKMYQLRIQEKRDQMIEQKQNREHELELEQIRQSNIDRKRQQELTHEREMRQLEQNAKIEQLREQNSQQSSGCFNKSSFVYKKYIDAQQNIFYQKELIENLKIGDILLTFNPKLNFCHETPIIIIDKKEGGLTHFIKINAKALDSGLLYSLTITQKHYVHIIRDQQFKHIPAYDLMKDDKLIVIQNSKPFHYSISSIEHTQEQGAINVLTEHFNLIVNDIFASSQCIGDGGLFMYYLGYTLLKINSKLPQHLFSFYKFLKKTKQSISNVIRANSDDDNQPRK